jgi:hypothetical protein
MSIMMLQLVVLSFFPLLNPKPSCVTCMNLTAAGKAPRKQINVIIQSNCSSSECLRTEVSMSWFERNCFSELTSLSLTNIWLAHCWVRFVLASIFIMSQSVFLSFCDYILDLHVICAISTMES